MDHEACAICRGLQHDFRKVDGRVLVSQLLKDIVGSRDAGCNICGILVDAVLKHVPNVTLETEGHLTWSRIWGGLGLSWTPGPIIGGFQFSGKVGTVEIDVFQSGWPETCSYIRFGNPPSGYTGSEIALDRAKEWLLECTTSHKLCCNNSSKPLPTRVLDLGPDFCSMSAKVHVAEKGHWSQYAALSHCWGSRGNHLTLTEATLPNWLQDFPLSDLPRTYRDAVTVAKRLGIRYLWIDSLCIIQDDKEDWKRESSKMAEIYQNAYLTIAATCAADSSAGIFRNARLEYVPNALTYSHDENKFYASRGLSHHHLGSDPFEEWTLQHPTDLPLLSRAWVYQERFLSPRILHFMVDELVYECKDSMRCECALFPSAHFSIKRQHTRWLDKNLGGDPVPVEVPERRWRKTVEEYTLLHMTFEKDMLPAISGIASQIACSTSDRYWAGLWESTFIEDLLWVPRRKGSKVRLRDWRAPSWSWASCGSPVQYRQNIPKKQHRSASNLEVMCVPSGVNALGELATAFMYISGIFGRGLLIFNEGRHDYQVKMDSGDVVNLAESDFDILDEFHTITLPVFCLGLHRPTEHHYYSLGSMMLLKEVVGKVETYERVGIAFILGNEPEVQWFEQNPRRRIKII